MSRKKSRLPSVKVSKCQSVKVSKCQSVKVSKCQSVKVSIWHYVVLRRNLMKLLRKRVFTEYKLTDLPIYSRIYVKGGIGK